MSDHTDDEIKKIVGTTDSDHSEQDWNICGRCGKPKIAVGDVFGRPPLELCTCKSKPSIPGVFEMPPSKGWQCPICERVYAPDVKECLNCRPEDSEAVLA